MPKVKVSAIPEKGFRRIGQSFTREPKEIEVTAKQLKELQDEKNLVVIEIPDSKDKGNK